MGVPFLYCLDASLLQARRTKQFHSLVRVCWGRDKIQNTCLPLGLLAALWLDESRELAVTEKENPLWHAILKPTDEKYLAWLERVHGKYMNKVMQTHANNRSPNLKVNASSYRDQEPELVFRAACLFVASHAAMVTHLSPDAIPERYAQFYRGALDPYLIEKGRALDRSLEFEALGYIRNDPAVQQGLHSAEQLAEDQNRHQLLSQFALFKVELSAEVIHFTNYMAAMASFNSSNQQAVTQLLEMSHECLEKAVSAHVATSFQTTCTKEVENWSLFFATSARTFSEAPPLLPEKEVYFINRVDLSALALALSKCYGSLSPDAVVFTSTKSLKYVLSY